MLTSETVLERFCGAWTLISCEQLLLASGKVSKPFGENPIGRIVYLKNGQMPAQLMNPSLASFANADYLKAVPEETDRTWRSYVGYWGTFEVDVTARFVTHNIEGAWFPNWIGQKQVRAFRFEGESLILEAESAAWRVRLTWRRME